MPSAATGESNKDEQVKYISQDQSCFMSSGTPSLSLSVYLPVCLWHFLFHTEKKNQLKTL